MYPRKMKNNQLKANINYFCQKRLAVESESLERWLNNQEKLAVS